jgi:hypothetical protein
MGTLIDLNAPYRWTPNMMIGKLEWWDESTMGAGSIDGRVVHGTFNNFTQPRSNLYTLFTPIIPFGLNNLVPLP